MSKFLQWAWRQNFIQSHLCHIDLAPQNFLCPIFRLKGSKSGCKDGSSKKKIKGKVAIVTGGSQGIGKGFVLELLKNGVKGVVIADVNVKGGEKLLCDICEKYGKNKAVFIKSDAAKYEHIKDAFKCAIDHWKRVDIVVNNAGILKDNKWKLEIDINCGGVAGGTIHAMKVMGKDKGGKGGTVVNVASILGLQAAPSAPVYTGTKHFVIGLTRSFGHPFHYDRTKVRVMAMCPGVTTTQMVKDAGQHALEVNKEKIVQELGSLPPQPTSCTSEGLIKMLKKGKSASIWVSEGYELYEVKIPDRRTLRKDAGCKGDGGKKKKRKDKCKKDKKKKDKCKKDKKKKDKCKKDKKKDKCKKSKKKDKCKKSKKSKKDKCKKPKKDKCKKPKKDKCKKPKKDKCKKPKDKKKCD